MYKPESAHYATVSNTWVELIAAPNENEVIAVRSITYHNGDTIAHLYEVALLIDGVRYIQVTTASQASGNMGFVDMDGVILLTSATTSLEVRTTVIHTTTESKMSAHFARRS